MKEVNFKKLTGKNFLSLGNLPVEFSFPNGINIITGYNYDKNDENGVGKSTIVNLFYWTLFGDTISNLKKEEMVNDINKKDCYGCLEFDVNKNGKTNTYKIERGIKPSFCKLWINGDEKKNLSSIGAINEAIQAIISSTANVFKNCIVLSMNNTVPFMAQTKTERKTFVESMFRLEALRHMEKLAREKYNELSHQQELNLEAQHQLVTNKNTFNSKKDDFEFSRNKKVNDLTNRKSEFSLELEKCIKSIIVLDDNELSDLKAIIEAQTKEKNKFVDIINNIKSEILSSERQASILSAEQKKISYELNLIKERIKQQPSEIKFEKSVTIDEKEKELKRLIETTPQTISEIKNEINKFELENSELQKTIDKIKKYGSICLTCGRGFSQEEQKNNQKEIDDMTSKIAGNKETVENQNVSIKKHQLIGSQAMLMLEFINKSKESKRIMTLITENAENLKSRNSDLEPQLINSEKITVEINNNITKKTSLEGKIASNNSYISQINNIRKFILSVDGDIETVKNEPNMFTDLIEDNNKKIEKNSEEVATTKNGLHIYDNIKFIVSEDGIKSYIIKKLVTILNERIAYYLNVFESNAKLTFDEYFDDTLFNDKGLPKSYDNFSGGERKRIDLACLFSFLDIRRIQGDVRFNVLFFDEILDSSISTNACKFVFNVLKERFELYGESSYLITHRKEFKMDSKDLVTSIIFLEKRNGFTKIKS